MKKIKILSSFHLVGIEAKYIRPHAKMTPASKRMRSDVRRIKHRKETCIRCNVNRNTPTNPYCAECFSTLMLEARLKFRKNNHLD